jgi:chloramphenicol-sensitive protein RarD
MIGKVPLVALTLAFTFGLYGLVRKVAGIQAVPGLTVEMVLLSPIALGYLGWLMAGGNAVFWTGKPGMDMLLVLAGVVTATPLVLYGGALSRLRLSTMGIMQYIVPTGHFMWAVFAFDEPFTMAHLVSFAFIWAALGLYTSESFGRMRPTTQAAGQTGT